MNRIYKIIRTKGTGQAVVASEFSKGNKKSLSGRILALSVAGILASLSISSAMASTVINDNNSGTGSLQEVLATQVGGGDTVIFNGSVNPTDITGIKIDKTDITIQGNGTLDVGSTVNDISHLIDSARNQAEDYQVFNEWLESDLQTEINNVIGSNNVDSSTLTKITVDGQTIAADDQNGLFYSQEGSGNRLNIKNLHITMNDGKKIVFQGGGTTFLGGGLIGSNATDADATIGNLNSNVVNKNNVVTSGKTIHGGGLIGAYSNNNGYAASIGDISNNVFSENQVETIKNYGVRGGGLIGVYSRSGTASIGQINSNIFSSNHFSSSTSIEGGGLIGVRSNKLSTLGLVSNSVFSNNSIITKGINNDSSGGGLIGLYGTETTIEGIRDNVFNGNDVTVKSIYGGGLIGVRGNSNAIINDISNNIFTGNTIIANNGNIRGGIIGQHLNSASYSATWGTFSNNIFTGNTVKAEGTNNDIYGGVLYSSGVKNELVISDSIFNNNKISTSGTVYATAVGINTKNKTTHTGGHELTLGASDGGVTYMANHADNEDNAAIYMGAYGENAQADAILNINPDTNGLVVLEAPINIDQNNGKKFTMNINGSGDFYWGGKNEITADGGSSVNFNSGRTTLLSGYSLKDNSNGGEVNFNAGSTTLVQLTEDPDILAPTINADKINVNSGSSFGINNTFSYTDDILTANLDKAILTLNATSGNAIDADSSTLENGKISIGVNDYDYTLTWQGSGTDTAELKFDYVESSKSYNKNLAGSAITMASGIMAYNLPATQTTNHYMSSLLRNNVSAFVTGEEATNWNLWMTPSYSYSKRSDGGDRIGYDVNTYGTTLGFDISPFDTNNAIIGVALSIYQQNFDATDTDVDGTTYLGQIYAGVTLPKNIEVLGNIGFGKVNYDQKRTVRDERLTAYYSSDIFFVGTQISKPFALSESVQIRPFFAYDYLNITVDSFNEKGNTYNLHSSSYDHDFHRTQLGTALTWSSDLGVDFGAKAFYQNLSGDRKAETHIYFINDSNQTEELSIGDAMARDSFGLGLSAATSLANNLSLEGNYQLNLASHTQSHQAKFTLTYAF